MIQRRGFLLVSSPCFSYGGPELFLDFASNKFYNKGVTKLYLKPVDGFTGVYEDMKCMYPARAGGIVHGHIFFYCQNFGKEDSTAAFCRGKRVWKTPYLCLP